MRKVIFTCLLVAGLIKFAPVVGLFSSEQLAVLYQLRFDHPDLLVLMRHRAVLFGLLGGFILLSAFKPAWRPCAIVAGLVSAITFIALVLTANEPGPALYRAMLADIVVVLTLTTAGILEGVVAAQR